MNTYRIPREGRTQHEYFDYVSSLSWLFAGASSLSIDPNDQLVTVDGTITGFDLVGTFTPSPQPVAPISKLDFRNRFTMDEKVAIYTAAKTSVTMQVWLEDLAAASEVNISHVQTIAGVQASLLQAYDGLPLADLRKVMAQGFQVAVLAGMADVKA